MFSFFARRIYSRVPFDDFIQFRKLASAYESLYIRKDTCHT